MYVFLIAQVTILERWAGWHFEPNLLRAEKIMVRKGGFEPPRLSAPPPQDGVSASSTTSALGKSLAISSLTFRQRVFQNEPDLPRASPDTKYSWVAKVRRPLK